MKVFVIVVTYNGCRWVDFCFGSLRESSYPIKTIVVDNNSSDGTVELISKKYPEVDLILSKENLGFGKANNQAIKLALRHDAGYVFLLNQDAAIEKNTIESLINAAQKNNEYGIISPLHFNGAGSALDFGFKNYIAKKYSDDLLLNENELVHPIDFINAAAWLVSSNCLKKVGGFGSLFFHYGEDRDYVNRTDYANVKVGFITNTKIFHDRENRSPNDIFSSQKKMTWYYSVTCSVWLADINKSLTQAIVLAGYKFSKDILYHILKARFYAMLSFFEVTYKMIESFPEIVAYRNLIKKQKEYLFIVSTDEH